MYDDTSEFAWQAKEELLAWILTATRGLCTEAIEHVRPEIESHYQDSYDDNRSNGMTEQEAHRAAMAALGPPARARRTFRKAYLTERQVERLQRQSQATRSRKQSLLWLALISVLFQVCPFQSLGYGFLALLLSVLLVLFVLMLCMRYFATRCLRKHEYRRWFLLETIGSCLFSAFLFLPVCLMNFWHPRIQMVWLLTMLFATVFADVPVYLKLTDESSQDIRDQH